MRYHSFFSHNLPPLATEILAAVLGTILVVLVTATLLHYQTAGEEQKEKTLGVFKHKLVIYSGFLDYVHTMISDGRITHNEKRELITWASRVCLVASENVACNVMDFARIVLSYNKFRYEDLGEGEKQKWYRTLKDNYSEFATENDIDLDDSETIRTWASLGRITTSLRDDLGGGIATDEEGGGSITSIVDELVHAIGAPKEKKTRQHD